MESLLTYLVLGALMFCIGIFGLLQHNSLIGMLIATELILNGASMNFMAFNMFLTPDPTPGPDLYPVHHGGGRRRSGHCPEHHHSRLPPL